MIVASAALLGYSAYCLADDGLANVLGLETLRHGTNLVNYIGIKIFGALPSHGQKATGSTKGWLADDTRNYFYVYKDTDYNFDTEVDSECIKYILGNVLKFPPLGKRVGPHYHKFLSGYNTVSTIFCLPDDPRNCCVRLFKDVVSSIGGLCSILTPTLQFRFCPEEVEQIFSDDPKYFKAAYRTTNQIGMWKVGLLGTLTQGLNLGIFERIKHNPWKFLTGLIQVITAVALAALCLTLMPTVASVAGPAALGLAVLI